MPVYEYECRACGGFTALRPMAEFQDPQPCPECGAVAPRVIHTAPAFAGMPAAARRARATNERSADSPRLSSQGGHVHGPGCGCGAGQKTPNRTLYHANGAKSFPTNRPWVINH
ncbi:MAG TPA: zinc ribbon domain-containing protein [Azospirillum sp.]|nr:zinc ribbon domain-containing protein [Azospirillum sp.]